MEKLRVIHTLYDNSATRLTQAAALPVVERLEAYRQRALALTDSNRPQVQAFAAAMQGEGLVEGDVPPDGCIYFPHLLGIEDTEGFVRFAAEQHRVLVVPGGFFGARSHVRVGFGGAPEQVSEGLGRLVDALRAYRRG
jgi:aspartate/methionine/tyrosine aminotransferase